MPFLSNNTYSNKPRFSHSCPKRTQIDLAVIFSMAPIQFQIFSCGSFRVFCCPIFLLSQGNTTESTTTGCSSQTLVTKQPERAQDMGMPVAPATGLEAINNSVDLGEMSLKQRESLENG